ncbi:MAG TPA: hypothetical protein VK843_03110 [Planctomycetota bacterium]|nr:hypothetical protein [Planctomycetota bacterium]
MAGVTGKTAGVASDITDYLDAVALHYGATITVTSGKRTPDEQGVAMFTNWIKLNRGKVYVATTLPDADRKALDAFFVTAKEDPKATAADKKKAEDSFKKLATEKVGKKSKHFLGRAVDIAKTGLPTKAYTAIKLNMKEVPEGRTDIYHFESEKVPSVTDAIKAKWPAK